MNKQFEKWFNTVWSRREDTTDFCDMFGETREGAYWTDANDFVNYFPLSIQWGVYLEFFDSVGIIIEVEPKIGECSIWIWEHNKKENCFEKLYSSHLEGTRTEAQQAAIGEAFEILEER